MDCREMHPYLEPYADGELGVSELAAVEAHLTACLACRDGVAEHRRFRQLLRRQPREAASPELRARVTRAVRASAVRQAVRPWLWAPVAAAVLIALVVGSGLRVPGLGPTPMPPLVTELVGKHIAYSQIDSPVEFASVDGGAVRDWFRERLGVRVTVPDYTPAGIRLLGGRIADTRGRRAAYLFYEKGRTLMSVFMVPGERFIPERAHAMTYGGATYYTVELEGQRAVFWSDDRAAFGLISTLDYDSLFQCADRLRAERAEDRRV